MNNRDETTDVAEKRLVSDLAKEAGISTEAMADQFISGKLAVVKGWPKIDGGCEYEPVIVNMVDHIDHVNALELVTKSLKSRADVEVEIKKIGLTSHTTITIKTAPHEESD